MLGLHMIRCGGEISAQPAKTRMCDLNIAIYIIGVFPAFQLSARKILQHPIIPIYIYIGKMQYYKDNNGFQPLDLTWITQRYDQRYEGNIFYC